MVPMNHAAKATVLAKKYLLITTGANALLAFICAPILIFAPQIIGIDAVLPP
jgi:hypothetical protein